VLDAPYRKLADAPMYREAGELRLGCVRRKDFHLPAAQVRGKRGQIQPDFYILCRRKLIVVEQVKNQSPAIWFASQLA